MLLLVLAAAQQPVFVPPDTREVPPVISVPALEEPPPAVLFQRAVPPKSVAPLNTYISPDDYPSSAMQSGQQGQVRIALRVDAIGRVIGCSVLESSRSAVLDLASCRLLQSRARFTPAKDAQGNAVESATRTTIRWVLPPRPPVPDRMNISYRITSDGRMVDCKGEMVTGGKTSKKADPDCRGEPAPAAFLAAVRSQSTAPEPDVRMEMRLLRSPSEPWPQLNRAGERVLARAAARMVVEPDGRVSSCTVVETASSIGGRQNPCLNAKQVEVKSLQQATEMRIVSAIMLQEPNRAAVK